MDYFAAHSCAEFVMAKKALLVHYFVRRRLNSNLKGGMHMSDRAKFYAPSIPVVIAILAGLSVFILMAGCGSSKPAAPAQDSGVRRYQMHGTVISIDKDKKQVVVDHGEIPGFMMAMTMGYAVKAPNLLESLAPSDIINADVVVNGDDVWLENIVVVKKANSASTLPAADSKPASGTSSKQ
jgi:protein SCO1/2